MTRDDALRLSLKTIMDNQIAIMRALAYSTTVGSSDMSVLKFRASETEGRINTIFNNQWSD